LDRIQLPSALRADGYADWDYTPTPYWGVYVKDALAGKKFELKKMR